MNENRWQLPIPWLGGALVAMVAAVLLFVAFGRSERIPGLTFYQDVGRGHDNDVTFSGVGAPPAGGVHNDNWLNCGIYSEPVDTGHAIHSLEHGAVWITYRPDLPAEQLDSLRQRVRHSDYLILSPRPAQESPIVLTAWAVQLAVPTAGDTRIDNFIAQYQLGPTAPELGASCVDGVGEPLP